MANEYTKPLPRPEPVEVPFWQATKNHELHLQRCLKCGNVWYPPGESCTKCASTDYKWSKMSGKGTIWSWALFYQKYFPSFAQDIPYNTVIVQLEEGPWMISNIVGINNQEIQCDMPVEAVFDDVTEEVALVKFKPII